ncbi:MAG: PIN domain-containing protein [Acetobacteraceae bacterium]
MRAGALLDSNVIIAILAEEHEHHAASLALLTADDSVPCALAAHSIAEAYTTLTRRSDHAQFRLTAEEAWAGLESVRAVTTLVGLTPPQAFDAVRAYAASGGIGSRLYDALIGQAAVIYGIPVLITWNTQHMRGLFPELLVATPASFLARRR